jgi:hypothetical protein
VLCSSCRVSAPEGSRFCPSCGRPLVDADAVTRFDASAVSIATDVTRLPMDALDVTRLPDDVLDVTRLPDEPVDAEAPLAVGALLGGRYRITRLLGRGGMGAVYLADDVRLGQPVALKLLPPALARDPKRLAQFHNEVSLARQISHPNVCRVYDISEIDRRWFLSMEYVDGEDLAAALARRGPLPENEAVELTRQICAGLAAVHARGVLHRDLKPANIMLNKAGQPQLMDFGIATAGTADDVREGTPTYMAPEQLLGEPVSVSSDIYALGLMMHEIFTGHRVFPSNTPLDTLVAQHRSTTLPQLDLGAIANPKLRDVIAQCLDRDPSRRPPSVQAVAAMLQVTLLDATTVGRRLAQNALVIVAVMLFVFGALLIVKTRGAGLGIGATSVAAAVVTAIALLRFPLRWPVSYKGHRIVFYVDPFRGERLYVDGRLVDRGRVGFNVVMRATLESGAGAGERITAESKATFLRISCRIVAESFI